MIPLCTTAMFPLQSTWGWAFTVVGSPCVAQRVCAMPSDPLGRDPSRRASRTAILPAAFCTESPPPFRIATPAES